MGAMGSVNCRICLRCRCTVRAPQAPFLIVLIILVASLGRGVAAPAPAPAKASPVDVISRLFPRGFCRASISPKFYKSLLISPVEGWVIVRATLSGIHLSGARVVRSDLDGAYDAPCRCKRATGSPHCWKLHDRSLESRELRSAASLDLQDRGRNDGAFLCSPGRTGGDQADYYGCARLLVLKGDGKWTEIMGPGGS